jgi:hypothetical protein
MPNEQPEPNKANPPESVSQREPETSDDGDWRTDDDASSESQTDVDHNLDESAASADYDAVAPDDHPVDLDIDDDPAAPGIDVNEGETRRSEKRKTQSTASRKTETRKRGKNAFKHGGSAQDLILLDEDRGDFDRLHQGVSGEWGTESVTVKHTVDTLVGAMWAQARVARFCHRELVLTLEPPLQKELELIEHVMVTLEEAEDEAAVKRTIGMLRHDQYQLYFEREFPRAKYKDFRTWLHALRNLALPTVFEIHRNAVVMQLQDFTFQTQQAEQVRAKCEQIMALQERAEARVHRAIKALVQLKTWNNPA